MAGHRVAHPTLKGPSVVKEIVIGIALGLVAGSFWKMHHWNEQRKVRSFYDLLDKGEISVVVPEDRNNLQNGSSFFLDRVLNPPDSVFVVFNSDNSSITQLLAVLGNV